MKRYGQSPTKSKSEAQTRETSGRPELPHTGPYTTKDQGKWTRATKMIGRGSARSSTQRYAQALGALANSGNYTAADVVFISAEGDRSGRLNPDWTEIDRAIQAGARLITDTPQDRARPYNIGERQVESHLRQRGYREIEAGVWVAPAADRNTGNQA